MTSKPETVKFVKVTIYHYRNPDIPWEEFYEQWSKTFAPEACPWLAEHGIVKYAQYHTPADMRALAAPIAAATGFQTLDYDGVTEMLVPSMAVLGEAMRAPFFQEKFAAAREKYNVAARSAVTVGWEEVKIVDGKYVPDF